jgi:DNA-binding phage protein
MKGLRGPYAPRRPLTADGHAICALVRAEIVRVGWSKTAALSGVERSALHRAFPANGMSRVPSFATVTAVAAAVGLEFTVRRRGQG